MTQTLSHRLEYARDLLAVLVLRELRVRYKRTVLGYAWSLLQPLAFAAIYYLVFKRFLKIDTGDVDFTLFMVTALFAWQWFSNGLSSAAMALVSNAPLITKVRFPRIYAVLSGFLNDTVHYLLATPVILLVLLLDGRGPHWAWLWQLPLLMVLQGTLVLGLGLLVAALNLFFRDLERLISIGLLMQFHLTPVVYPARMVPDDLKWILYVNPMAPLVMCWRDAILYGRMETGFLLAAAGTAAAAMALGYSVFRRLEPRFAEFV